MQISMFSSVGPHANRSASPDFEKDLLTHAGASLSPTLRLLDAIAHHGWFGKTSPACYQIDQALSDPLSVDWQRSGMGGPTEFWTLNISAWHSGASVCSLSQVLEDGPVPQRHFLSARACAGILLRAEKRGKKLPTLLRTALTEVAQTAKDSG